MKIVIRKVQGKENNYIGYLSPGFIPKACFFVYFADDIFGSISLNRFIEMSRRYFSSDKVDIDFIDKEINFKNTAVIELIDRLMKN